MQLCVKMTYDTTDVIKMGLHCKYNVTIVNPLGCDFRVDLLQSLEDEGWDGLSRG